MHKRFKFICRYAKPYLLKLLLVLFIILVTTIIVAMYPFIFGKLIDALFYKKDMPSFMRIVVFYCGIFLVNQVLHFILDMTMASLRTKFSFDIKRDIFRKVLSYKSEKLKNLNTGDIIYRISNDADEVLNFIKSDIFYGLSALLDFIVCLGMTAMISLSFAGISLILAFLTFFLSKHFSKILKPLNKKISELTASNESWLFEFLNGMRDIKLLSASRYCTNKYLRNDFNIIGENNKKLKQEVIAERGSAAMQLVDSLCIYTFSAFYIISGSFTLGGMIACIDYFNRMTLMLSRLYARTFTIFKRMVSIDRILEIEKEPSEEYEGSSSIGEIEFGDVLIKNVVFSYEKNVNVLNGVSLHIKPCEKISLVGKSGAGKSTLAELMCRLYDVDEGNILVDGINIKDYNLQDFRRQVGIVHQETIMFSSSIRYNLVFSNNTNFDDKIWTALQYVKMDEVIKNMPSGLDTILDSNSIPLSGGQKQRLAIARIYLKNPKILIFDESTSALDGKTEFDITETLSSLFKDRTIIIIAHRFSTIIKSDRVACLHSGKIVGFDSHRKLLETCPPYKKLYLEQYLEEEGKSIEED